MCFLNLNSLTDEEIEKKILIINKKIDAAYGTSIAQNYISTLENTLDQLYILQEERLILKAEENKKRSSGVVMETDPYLAELLNQKKTSDEEEVISKKREFSGPKIVKTYNNNK